MQLKARPVHYTESGYRLQSGETALQTIDRALARHSIACRHIPLSDHCDLGFQADCFVGDEHERNCGVGNHLHFGKGFTRLQSLLSGKYETVERASSYANVQTTRLRGSFNNLEHAGYNLVDLEWFALPDSSLVGRADLYLSTVRCAYDADQPLDWVEVWSVRDQAYVHLPICFVHSIQHKDPINNICHNRPNGLSSGTCLEEAILGGLFELIERDACCLFAVHSLPVPLVDPGTIDIPRVQEFLENAATAGIDVTIKNCTTSLGIPAFCTFLHDRSPHAPRASSGAGAHISKEIALVRSVAEACLERAVNLWQLPSHKKLRVDQMPRMVRWEAAQYNAKVLGTGGWRSDYVGKHKATQSFAALPSNRFDDLKEAVEAVLQVLAVHGIEHVYVADLTRYNIPTVRVVAPDLEFAPKALYRIRAADLERARRLWQEPIRMGYSAGTDFTFLEGLGNDHLL